MAFWIGSLADSIADYSLGSQPFSLFSSQSFIAGLLSFRILLTLGNIKDLSCSVWNCCPDGKAWHFLLFPDTEKFAFRLCNCILWNSWMAISISKFPAPRWSTKPLLLVGLGAFNKLCLHCRDLVGICQAISAFPFYPRAKETPENPFLLIPLAIAASAFSPKNYFCCLRNQMKQFAYLGVCQFILEFDSDRRFE